MNNYDVIIIGAGIIGLSTAYKLKEKNLSLKICILEKEITTAAHQTGHNSGVIHSGIYYKPGSLKAVNCMRGYALMIDFCNENEIPYEICGKIIIATQGKELPSLETIFERGIRNGLEGIKIISDKEIKDIEPNAAGIRGIFVPQTGIVDYKVVTSKVAQLLINKNIEIKFGEEVKAIKLNSDEITIKTKRTDFKSTFLISCAGLQSDRIAEMMNVKINFRIIPFRGEYFIIRDVRKDLIRNLIYPVPDPEFPFLGVHFTRRISGEIEAGPNAVLALKREGYKKSDFNFRDAFNTLSYRGFQKIAWKYMKTGLYGFYSSLSKKRFVNSLQRMVPEIKESDLIKGGSGVRAQACSNDGKLIDDFLFIENERAINVCNAPSPAATSAFAIGETIADKVLKQISN